jgi:hypothetical protein
VICNRVGATVACPGIAVSAWPSCLGAGTVAQGAGGGNEAEAAEVLAGLVHLLLFVVPAPHGGCTRRGQGVAHTEHSLDKTGLFMAVASGFHGQSRGTGWQQQPLIIKYFRGILWWTIRSNVGIGTSYEVRRVETKKKYDNGDIEIQNADEALNQQSTEWGHPLAKGLGEGW